MDLLFCLHYLLTEKYMSGKNSILYGWSSYRLVSYDDVICDYIKCKTYTGSDFRRSVERPFLFADCYFLSIAAYSYAVKVWSRKKPPCNDRMFLFSLE